ncbi:hypothetical protein [Streptomyces sp. AV19]|uniref:hypothetical protein n=1 Tax=Streptomyces sp. AV19 TaxID=2793068 RepID=UPI001F3BDAAD|nr:hypothetical protein [Streptomyces sp. AV19]MDG4536358.1 hypothetical protein [Streptomyces sp. AV19]
MNSNAFYAYFHVSYASIGFSFSDLVLASLRLITMPVLITVALAALAPELPAFLASMGLPARWSLRARRAGHAVAARYPWFVLAGVLLMALWPFVQPYAWGAPLLVACGLLLKPARPGGGQADGRRLPAAALAGLFVLWAVALVADQQGQRQARRVADRLVERTSVAVLSTDPLAIAGIPQGPAVEDLGKGRHYRYRYTRLRLLVERGKRYYLLPLGWRHRTDPTYVIEDDDSIRIELYPGVQ